MKISMDKKYETRGMANYNILPAKIYSVEGNQFDYIHGAILKDGKWISINWTQDGKFLKHQDSEYDLVEVKERKKIEGWVNVYSNAKIGLLYNNKEDADRNRDKLETIFDRTPFACVKVTIDCEEGEGL
jgi:hypothetical protein